MHNTEVKSEVFSIEMNQKKKKHPKNPTKL